MKGDSPEIALTSVKDFRRPALTNSVSHCTVKYDGGYPEHILKETRYMINPKTHDSLFKWLITAFTEDFFAHYFPDITKRS